MAKKINPSHPAIKAARAKQKKKTFLDMLDHVLMPLREIQEGFGVKRGAMRKLITSGELPYIAVRGELMVSAAAWGEWLARVEKDDPTPREIFNEQRDLFDFLVEIRGQETGGVAQAEADLTVSLDASLVKWPSKDC